MTTLIPRSALPMLSTDSIFDMMNDFICDSRMSPKSSLPLSFKIDIKEEAGNYIVEAELPGVKKDEITLFMEKNCLKISVEHDEETEEKKDNYLHRERRRGAMQRSFYLADASAEGIEANLNDGVLSITVPKKQNDEAQKIEIK